MGNVNIKFNGKEYLLSCEDGQEEHLEELSINFNEKFNSLKNKLGNIGENKLLLISSITVMDEYFETKKNLDNKKNEVSRIINKFLELKSLVLEYKKDKDDQINNLNDQLNSLKKEIDQNKNNYDEILENTTKKIEQFIKKNSNENPIQ